MADLKDLLKTQKVKKFKRKEKSRPWNKSATNNKNKAEKFSSSSNDELISTKEKKLIKNKSSLSADKKKSIDESSRFKGSPTETSSTALPSDTLITHIEALAASNKERNQSAINTTSKRNQSNNNTKSTDYVIKSDYVINTKSNHDIQTTTDKIEPESAINTTSRRNQSNNNTESTDYVIKSDYVINTKSNHDIQTTTDKIEPESAINTTSKRNQSTNNTESHTESSTQSKDQLFTIRELIYSLPKREDEILSFLINLSRISNATILPKLTYREVSNRTEVSVKTVKNTISRLRKKHLLILIKFTKGPGSGSIWQIPETVLSQYLLKNTLDSSKNLHWEYGINTQSRSPQSTQSEAHSSSNNFNLKNTTTINENDLDSLLSQIEIPEEVLNVGFNESHLRQIIPQYKLEMNTLQESLNHYALDLQNGSVRAGFGKLNMIVGILKKSNQYVSEAYISEEQNMLKELAERKKLLDELEKQKAEIDLLKKFNSWKEGLTQDQINNYVPPSNLISEGSKLQDIQLQGYFETNFNENEGK